MFTSYLKTYFKLLILVFVLIGIFNVTIDPLWYSGGNRLTGVNFSWNERISKTNLFLQNRPQTYDCVLFGTSRSTLFRTSSLTENRCFNYSFSSGKIEEFLNYAAYMKQKGFKPAKVYVEVDPRSFDKKSEVQSYSPVTDPMPVYRAYLFSLGALQLSYKTITRDHSTNRIYDQKFEGKLDADLPVFQPELISAPEKNTCDPARIEFYRTLKQTFPDASFVGFVAPVSAWYVFNERYSTGLMNCQLAGVYTVSNFFEQMYDFSVPSDLTTRLDNTYDGNHYFPRVFARIAKVLEQKQTGPGINLDQYSLASYQALYASRLREFLEQQGQIQLWQG